MAIVRLCARQVGGINGIQPTHQMPGHELFPALRPQEISRVFSRERQTARTVSGRRQKIRQIPAHPRGAVGFVNRHFVHPAVGIVNCQVKQRGTNQGRQPRQGLCRRTPRIPSRPLRAEGMGDEILAALQGMPGHPASRPGLRQPDTKILQDALTQRIRQCRRPDPLHAERRLAPSLRLLPIPPPHPQPRPRAGDFRQGPGPEL